MNLNQTTLHTTPFNHWELSDCLDDLTLKEIVNATVPEGTRAYDGTRAADHSGQGIDGKLRRYITKENSKAFPHLKKLISNLHLKMRFWTKILAIRIVEKQCFDFHSLVIKEV